MARGIYNIWWLEVGGTDEVTRCRATDVLLKWSSATRLLISPPLDQICGAHLAANKSAVTALKSLKVLTVLLALDSSLGTSLRSASTLLLLYRFGKSSNIVY